MSETRGKKKFDLPSAEKVQEELSNAENRDDFFGRDDIFSKLFANTMEQMLVAKLSDHLGYERSEAKGRKSGNNRNGYYDKKVRSSRDDVNIQVPRDRKGSNIPNILIIRRNIMAKITVLGAGVMATAIAIPLSDNGHEVHLVGTHLDGEVIDEIRTRQRHPRLRTPVPDGVHPYELDSLEEALVGADLLLLGVNSQGIRWAANTLGSVSLANTPILMIAKGLVGEGNHLHILPEIFRQSLPEAIRSSIQIAAIGGPSIAGELADRRHTCITITGSQAANLEAIAAMLRTPYYHIWPSLDMIGVEVSVAMKNIYAVGVGFVYGQLEKQGIGNIHNPAAAVFAQGLRETAYLVEFLGGDLRSVYTLPGAGDGFVTCQGGRNMQIGRRMGQGMIYREAIAMYKPNERPEGPPLAMAIGPTVREMIECGKLDGNKLPLLCKLIDVFIDEQPFEIPWDAFFG